MPEPAHVDRGADPSVARELIHGTAVVIGDRAVLICGPSGAGKSDLALRLIDRGALLVADDQVIVEAASPGAIARVPVRIAGRIEVRGLGLIDVAHADRAPLGLWVDLGPETERMPEQRFRTVAGVRIDAVTIDPRPASAPVKVEWALQHLPWRNR